MKKFIQKIIKYLYWKLNCHTTEPFADQLVLYALPGAYTKEQLTLLTLKLNTNLNEYELLSACYFPDKKIEHYQEPNFVNNHANK